MHVFKLHLVIKILNFVLIFPIGRSEIQQGTGASFKF